MKKSMFAALTLALLASSVAPSFATDDDSLDKFINGTMMITRVGGLGTGIVVGTPVAVTRRTVTSYKSFTNDLADKVGGHEFGPSVAVVSLVTAPAAIVWGATTGLFYGSRNAVAHFNEPFTPHSFSVQSDYDESSK